MSTTDSTVTAGSRSGARAEGTRRGRLFVIAAPSGTGKTSLVKALMAAMPELAFSVSHTTRRPRPAEIDGKDYHFVDHDAFRRMIADGEFLEHASVFDNFYGTGRRQVEDALARGQDLILEIDWQGAQQVRAALPEAIDVFILPPSREALEERLRARPKGPDDVIARRLKDSVTELSHWHEFKYVVVNDKFGEALEALIAIVKGKGEHWRSQRPEIRTLAAGLLA